MGTRSLTYFYQDGEPFAAFYRQFDGYPDGHGAEIGKILAGIKLVNGYLYEAAGTHANGPGCLAAQVVAELKNESGIGGIYLINPNPEDHKEGWQEYEYHIHVNLSEPQDRNWKAEFTTFIECRDPVNVIFSGPFVDFLKWATKPKRNKEGEYIAINILPNKGKVNIAKHAVKTDLRSLLQVAEVEVIFTKADGSTREMRCTTDMARIPEDKQPAGTSKVADSRHDPKLFKVFDLDKQDWRSFREERVVQYEEVV
jgi:hypothetical protein